MRPSSLRRIAIASILALVLAAPIRAQEEPRVLADDLRIERFGDAPPHAVRFEIDPVTDDFLCVTLEGDVYTIGFRPEGGSKPVRIAGAGDHGITRLQGLAIHDSTIYVTGNVAVNNGKGTRGRLVRGDLNPDGTRTWSVVFNTDEFGTVRTAFDHGFNATILDPDERHLYVTSGSRTDHGEVQDNEGHYPGARDEPLTAVVLRIPADATGLQLPNEVTALSEGGYLFARGIRNAFDMAFSPAGHLFAVSNSGDYDHPEDMFWVREGHHYGFPWVMGGIENPQQDPDFEPDPDSDPFLNRYSHAYSVGYFHNDPDFPKRPPDLRITPAVANIGPDANYYRDPATGKVKKGDETGTAVQTFTPHRSLLGLTFDVDSTLASPYTGDGFMLGWTNGEQSVLMGRLSDKGSDLMHLTLFYQPAADNYIVRTKRIAEGFTGPVDTKLVGRDLYVLEYGGSEASIWRIRFAGSRPPGSN